jgi:hypothetical protein
VEKIATQLAVLQKMDCWSAFQVLFPVKKQMRVLATKLTSLEDVLIKHKNDLQQERHQFTSSFVQLMTWHPISV